MICRSDEFRTFNRSSGQQIPELLHEPHTKRLAFLSTLIYLLSMTCGPWGFLHATIVFPQPARAPVCFPMFSCHVVEAGLHFPYTSWHEQKHQNSLALGPKLPRLKSSPVASESSRNSSRRWKTLAGKASPISTRAGPEQSCNSASVFAARLAKSPRNFKSIGTTNSSWRALRTRSRASS